MQNFDVNRDTAGVQRNDHPWITLRKDAGHGVGLGAGNSISPGETRQVPRVIAERLVRAEKAWWAEEPIAAVEEEVSEDETEGEEVSEDETEGEEVSEDETEGEEAAVEEAPPPKKRRR